MQYPAFLNVWTKDVLKSRAFYQALGFHLVKNYSDEQSSCIAINDQFFMMILSKDKFLSFVKNQLVDSSTLTEMILSLDVKTKDSVDLIAEKALLAGAIEIINPVDNEWMYYRSLRDTDGHHLELFAMKG